MARPINVEITGDSRKLDKAFQDAASSAQSFNQALASGAARGLAIGAGLFAAGSAANTAGDAFKFFAGRSTETSNALTDLGDVLRNPTRLFEVLARQTERNRQTLETLAGTVRDANSATRLLTLANAAQSMGLDDLADKYREQAAALTAAAAATAAADFAQREYNVTVLDGVNALVAFKGAADDMAGMRGVGLAETIRRTPTPGRPSQGLFLTPSERREIALLGAQGLKRIPLLQDRVAQLNAQLERGVKSHAAFERISERIARTQAEILEIQQTANREAAERARLAREAAQKAELARELGIVRGPIPTPVNLRRQLEQLQGRIRAGETVPRAIRDRLGAIARLLREHIEPQTREAIRDYFAMVRQELNQGDQLLRRFPGAALNTNALVSGLGLSANQIRRLRMRLAGAGTGGAGVSGAYGIPLTVVLDGQVVGRSTKRFMANDRIHGPSQKRGPNAGR